MSDAAVFMGTAAVRAGVLITGTEVLTGIISDRNGPWLSERLRDLGVDVAMIEIVGDRPGDLRAALGRMSDAGVAIIVTSGGLGPTADDLTAELVAEFTGRPLQLDEALEARIRQILTPLLTREPERADALISANRKQALVPAGATVLDPVGTAPGLVVPPAEVARRGADQLGAPTIVVLPGPPRELQPLWARAVDTDVFRDAIRGATVYRREMVRLFGIPEAEISETLRDAAASGIDLRPLEITTCLRRGEIEVSARFEPAAQPNYRALRDFMRDRHGSVLFSLHGETIDEQVRALLTEQGATIAVAESCTGGMLSGRFTDPAGASEYFLGGVAAYSNEAKINLVGVERALIEAHGAVSAEVAQALADGARASFGANVGVGITGVAGPGGGSPEKPVGYVCFCASVGRVGEPAERRLTRVARLPGDRGAVRERSTTVAMHLVARLLQGRSDRTEV
jgi:nicotinamide-nucleotide amidase